MARRSVGFKLVVVTLVAPLTVSVSVTNRSQHLFPSRWRARWLDELPKDLHCSLKMDSALAHILTGAILTRQDTCYQKIETHQHHTH